MRMHRPLYLALFLIGLGIIWSAFFFLVPDEAKTNIAYLNIIILNILYLVGWGSTVFIFPSKGDAGDYLAGTGIFWSAAGGYAGVSLFIMLLGWNSHWSFKTQLFLQIIVFFFFAIGCVNAIFAMEHVSASTKKDHATISKVRMIQDLITRINAQAATLPEGSAAIKREIHKLEEEAYYLSGIDNPAVEPLDDRIIALLKELQIMISLGQEEDIQNTTREIIAVAAQRKTYKTQG